MRNQEGSTCLQRKQEQSNAKTLRCIFSLSIELFFKIVCQDLAQLCLKKRSYFDVDNIRLVAASLMLYLPATGITDLDSSRLKISIKQTEVHASIPVCSTVPLHDKDENSPVSMIHMSMARLTSTLSLVLGLYVAG